MHANEEKGISQTKESFWGFFVNNWRVTLLALIIFVLGGFVSLFRLPLESDPEVKIPIAIVTTAYPGAAPQDIEKLITDRIEEKLKNLDDLDNLTSSSSEGVSSITVEFDAKADLVESIRDLRDEIENIKADLPEDATDPIVTEISVSDQPIITVSLLSNLPPKEMKEYGEDSQDILEGIPGVSEVILSGLQNEEMQVLVNIQKLEGYGLSLSEVVSAISRNHIDFPIGNILTDGFYYTASLKAQFNTPEELLALPIASKGNQNIYLRDIAEVREAFAEKTSDARVYRVQEGNLLNSITLQVKKKTGANIIDITDAVKAEMDSYKKEKLPPGVDVLLTNDWSSYVREDIHTLGISALQTIVIIFVVLFIALGRKEALMVGFSIPLIFLITFVGLELLGETLNGIVLFALILSLGLLVDTSIVIMEGIYEGVKEKGLSGRDAALLAIHTYKAPLISGTLTTVAVFIPMLMMSGIVGEFIKHLPITVILTLSASLFVAILILSSIAARVFRNYHKQNNKDSKPLFERFIIPLRKWYTEKITKILASKAKRRSWMIGMVIAFFLSLSLPITGILKAQMFPPVDFDFFMVNVELPVGATLPATAAVTEKVEALIPSLPEVENYVSIIGGAGADFGLHGGGEVAATNKSQITINLTKMDTRDIKSYDIADMMREKIKPITEADVEVEEIQAGPPTGAPVEIRVEGDDVNELEKASEFVMKELEKMPGTRDVTSDSEAGTGEFQFRLKRDRLSFYGVSAAQVASELRSAVFGNDSVKILRNGEETPIVVALDFRDEDCLANQTNQILEKRDRVTLCGNHPQTISQLKNILIATPKGMVPVSELTEIELYPAITIIRHRDTKTVVNVRAYTREGYLATQITNDFEAKLPTFQNQISSTVKLEFGGETEDVTESFMSLYRAMGVGIFLIILILVLQFDSFRQPFIIMFTLPLALIGVFSGLTLLGRNLSFPGFIGIVALSGVVVNDAIVLIDRINQNIRKGMPKLEAIITSGGERLQPIILTTVTTAFGVLPLAFANELWGDLAWSIALGISFSTILTLVMVPIFYNALEDAKELENVERE